MKKSLIALAVLAASGAAMAQSSVTLFGRLDASVGQTSTEATGAVPVAKLSQNVINSAALNTTFWGLKGTEDLGGGLRANFELQSQFTIDNGAAANTLFERKAVVGLSGAFGAVDLGRQYTAYDALRGATNNVNDFNFATTGTVWKTGVTDYTNRVSNSIGYTSPTFSGISGAVVLGLGEDKTATNSASSNNSLHIKYANGPVLVGYAYQEQKAAGATVPTVTNKYNLLGASYNFGVAKLTGSYNTAKDGTRDDKEYQVGVSAPFGAATVYAGYTNAKSTGAGLADLAGSGFALVGTYDLSKRTTLYAGYNASKVETGTIGAITQTKATGLATGVRHTF